VLIKILYFLECYGEGARSFMGVFVVMGRRSGTKGGVGPEICIGEGNCGEGRGRGPSVRGRVTLIAFGRLVTMLDAERSHESGGGDSMFHGLTELCGVILSRVSKIGEGSFVVKEGRFEA
jgi:hypothetical protein